MRFLAGHIAIGADDAAYALFRLGTSPYAWADERERFRLHQGLERLPALLGESVSLFRVARPYPAESYVEATARRAPESPGRSQLARLLEAHAGALSGCTTPEVYLQVGLAEEPGDAGDLVCRFRYEIERRVGRLLGTPAGPVPAARLARLRDAAGVAERALRAALGARGARPASTAEIMWLRARAPWRGVGGPLEDDPRRTPGAIVLAGADGLAFEPQEDWLAEAVPDVVIERGRALAVEHEDGRTSHQAVVVVGGLPEEVHFPGPAAELAASPLEELPFPVDVAIHARHVPNRAAVAEVRKRLRAANDALEEQHKGGEGVAWEVMDAPEQARELEHSLTRAGRRPLLRTQVLYAVGAPSVAELRARVEELANTLSALSVTVHRPFGLQGDLYRAMQPASAGTAGYRLWITTEQWAGFMPVAADRAGTETGPYVGVTTGSARTPVLLDVRALARANEPPTVLATGRPGAGKTMFVSQAAVSHALSGVRVIDIDPKGDHHLDRVPHLEGLVGDIRLRGDEAGMAGALDPLVVAPPEIREEVAVAFLEGCLGRVRAEQMRTELRRAVQAGEASENPCLGQVIAELEAADDEASRRLAADLRVFAESGLSRIGIAMRAADAAGLSDHHPVTLVRTAGIALPAVGSSPETWDHTERVGVALMSLLAAFALGVISHERRSTLVVIDEAWALLASETGRALLERLVRTARALDSGVLLASQRVGDMGELESLIGVRAMFRQGSAVSAREALELLGLDPGEEDMIGVLLDMRAGACLWSDVRGGLAQVQIEIPDERLLRALETTPEPEGAAHESGPDPGQSTPEPAAEPEQAPHEAPVAP